MSVYVDDMRASFGRMVMCHMVADSTEELLAMVDRIGVDRQHIQHAGTAHEHFDVSLGKRRLAVKYGAIEVGARELNKVIEGKLNRRAVPPLPQPLHEEGG